MKLIKTTLLAVFITLSGCTAVPETTSMHYSDIEHRNLPGVKEMCFSKGGTRGVEVFSNGEMVAKCWDNRRVPVEKI